MKAIEKIKQDPRVKETWYEGEDGWWVSLKKGFICHHSGAHFLHEQTVADLRDAMSTVKPCTCKECNE